MNHKPENTADITAELRSLSRSAECCELLPKVFGKPISFYFAELADRIDAANASNVENIGGAAIEAIALLGRIGKTGDGRIHLHDLVNIDNAKARLQTAIAHCEMRSTVRNGDSAQQPVHNMVAMYEALTAVKKLFDGRIMFQQSIRDCHRRVNAAFEEPPRNCDRLGGDIDKLRVACLRERGLNPEEDFPDVFPEWLLAPMQKGCAK